MYKQNIKQWFKTNITEIIVGATFLLCTVGAAMLLQYLIKICGD